MSVQPQTPDLDNDSMEDRLYTVKYDDPGDSHLDVKVTDVCAECETNDCVRVCPANVWREGDDGVPHIAYENCLECSSCRFACTYDNVVWTYPERGAGMTYKHG
ncbi:ferredoxin like protein [Halobiforma haloterrestris]|uniref:Ferredoxin-like protein n=1 Tax=Natronobacterium haloterrestre TaxID=148448 RepID=A0A1I1IF56_NATHA|nr:4Fe-4S dicluster domain-containing protein [Halobiforma haloterrestris]SFC34886.1 ferredoxin like protein [Halobiforma haloterrestris]